jgi:hypothetical protein
MSPKVAQITHELEDLNITDLLSVFHFGLDALVKKIEKKIPEKFINARLLQICYDYPMPNIHINENNGEINETTFHEYMKKGLHNFYTATIIKDDSIPDNSLIMIWFINNTGYRKIFEIRPKEGVGRWFHNGLFKVLNESRISSYKKEYHQVKITINNEDIQNRFLFSKVSEDKTRDWHRIRDKIKSYNDIISTEIFNICKNGIKPPPLFQFVNSKRPSQGLIINIAECDICLINSTLS